MNQWQEDELYGGMVDWDEQYDQDDARAAEEELSYLENFDWTDDEYEDEIDYWDRRRFCLGVRLYIPDHHDLKHLLAISPYVITT